MARQYAPALTPKQFKQLRPNGTYSKYVSYLTRHRPGWKPEAYTQPQHVNPPMRGPSYTYDALLRRLQILNPKQMEAQANRMANAQLKSQQAIIDSGYKQAQEEAMNRMRAFAAAGNQAAAMNASLIGQVGGQYQAGADQLNAMSTGLAGQMAGATDASVAAADAAAGNVGMPGVTVGGPVGGPGLAGAAQAGVESYYGGTLPAQAMQNAGGYAQAGMAGQISSQNLRATQEAQAAYMQAMGDANRAKSSAVTELARGRPDLAMKYLSQLQDNQRQAIALAGSLVGAGFEQGMTKKEYTQKVKQQQVENVRADRSLNAQIQHQNWGHNQSEIELAAKLGQVDVNKSAALGYVVDTAGRPILQNGQRIPWNQFVKRANAQGSSSSTKGGGRQMTPGQYVDLMQKASNTAETNFYGYAVNDEGKRVPVNQIAGFDPDAPDLGLGDKKVTGRMNYQQQLARLRNMGLSPVQARGVLSTYYGRGEAGAPIFSGTEMKQYRKSLGRSLFNRALQQIRRLQNQDRWDEADQLIGMVISGNKAGLTRMGPPAPVTG